MFRWSFPPRRSLFLALVFGALSVVSLVSSQDAPHRGRKYKAPAPTARVEVTVLRATNGKPVENAAVVFHPLVDGKDSGNMELKTNDEGKAVIDLLDLGSNVRLQVIAPGFQTFGEDYKVDKDNLTIEIKLKRPAEQYSVYKKSEGKTAPPDASGKPQHDAGDAAPKDAPSETKPDVKADPPKDDTTPQTAAPPKWA